MKLKFKKIAKKLAWVAVLFILIAFLCPAKFIKYFPSFRYMDKIIHALSFFFLDLLFSLGYPQIRYTKLSLSLFLFGLGIEFLQKILPFGRTFDLYDILSNLFGLILVFPFLGKIKKILN